MKQSISTLFLLPFLFAAAGCSTTYQNRNPMNQPFPSVTGKSLSGQSWKIPEDLQGKKTLLLIGYVQETQFDIDRWLIGLDQTQTKIDILEVPTIAGFFPGLFQKKIDSGMRSGIPKPLWKIVVTIYDDGAIVQKFTGNQNPRNARVVLLNKEGKIVYFHDGGFSVPNLNRLRERIQSAQ